MYVVFHMSCQSFKRSCQKQIHGKTCDTTGCEVPCPSSHLNHAVTQTPITGIFEPIWWYGHTTIVQLYDQKPYRHMAHNMHNIGVIETAMEIQQFDKGIKKIVAYGKKLFM